jgi:hypothetical protein
MNPGSSFSEFIASNLSNDEILYKIWWIHVYDKLYYY